MNECWGTWVPTTASSSEEGIAITRLGGFLFFSLLWDWLPFGSSPSVDAIVPTSAARKQIENIFSVHSNSDTFLQVQSREFIHHTHGQHDVVLCVWERETGCSSEKLNVQTMQIQRLVFLWWSNYFHFVSFSAFSRRRYPKRLMITFIWATKNLELCSGVSNVATWC